MAWWSNGKAACIVALVLLVAVADGQKVAVVGAGAGGAAAARYLREELGSDADIRVFERRWKPGGRVCSGWIDGQLTELGGSVYHKDNHLIASWVEEAGLHVFNPALEYPLESGEHDGEALGDETQMVNRLRSDEMIGVWNGEEFTFSQSTWSAVNLVNGLWRYGFDPKRVGELANVALRKFLGIYEVLDDPEQVFETVEELLDGIEMRDLTHITLRTYLDEEHACSWGGGTFCDEFVTGMTRVNYGQSDRINALVGLISLIGSTDDIRAAAEGNFRAVEHALHLADASVRFGRTVSKVEKIVSEGGQSQYCVSHADAEGANEEHEGAFDVVVIATPLEATSIEFVGLELPLAETGVYERPYQLTHVTFVTGELKYEEYFRVGPGERRPHNIITPETDNVELTSIFVDGKYTEGDKEFTRFKVFSRHELFNEALSNMFDLEAGKEIYRTKFYAYPVLTPKPKGYQAPRFDLHQGEVFYVNALESVFSTIETEIISGRNIAKLIARSLAARGESK